MTGKKYFSKFNLKVHTVTDQLSVLATYFKTKSFSMGAFLHWVLNSVKVKTAKSVQRKFFRKNYLRKVSSKIDHKNRCYFYWIYSPISTGCWVTCSYHLNKDLECKQNGLKFSHEMFACFQMFQETSWHLQRFIRAKVAIFEMSPQIW